MKKEPYHTLPELSQHLYKKWYQEDWESNDGAGHIAKIIRDLAVIGLTLWVWIVIFCPETTVTGHYPGLPS